MKTALRILLMVIFVIVTGRTFAQVIPVDDDTKKVIYKEVVTETGTPLDLYKRAIAWINSFYPNPSDVTRVRDEANSKIELKHRIKVSNIDKDGNKTTDAALVEYEMSLEFKDGRYRYTITNFNVKKVSKFPMERWMNKTDPEYVPADDNYLKQVNDEVNNIITSLKKGMKAKAIKNDNW